MPIEITTAEGRPAANGASQEVAAPSEAASSSRFAAASLQTARDKMRMLGLSVALWALYVPHTVILSALGPKLGMHWVRIAAHIHWMLTFVGCQRSSKQALTHLKPYFVEQCSASEILRRHLLLKHECFARVRVWSFHGTTSRPQDLTWRVHPDSLQAVPPERRERGLLVVGFHYNFYQFSAAAFASLRPGMKIAQLRYRNAQSVDRSMSPVARLAIKRALEADRRAGATVFHIDDADSLTRLYRLLQQGGVVALTADGMAADDFIDVPFFDGLLRVPSGWAKLAAATKAQTLVFADRSYDRQTREGWFFNHIRCSDKSDQAAYAAVAESIRILQQMICAEPWGWHPWQRLRVAVGDDGVRRYSLKQYGFEEGKSLDGKPATAATLPAPALTAAADASANVSAPRRRPRVAVVANSYPPYRVYLHKRIAAEIPEVELWSLSTHGNAYSRWKGLRPPAEIRPVDFSRGEPTNEQPQVRYSPREWRKGGRIIRWLKEKNIDAVFVQGCGDMGRLRIIHWCKRRGIPCFLTGDFNIRSDNHRPLKRWLKRRVYNRGVGWSYGLMPCGEHGLALLHRYRGEGKPAYMFPFVPDVQLFENTPAAAIEQMRERFKLQPGRRRLLFSARMMEVKRPDLAVNAFGRIADERPEWDLVMVGDGPLRIELEASVPSRLRERVIWTGFLNSPEEIAGVYAQCDAMVLPSDHEPWGVVVVEAAAAGLAIVTSDNVGAAPELVRPGINGAVFRAGDLSALIEALREITAADRVDEAKIQSLAVLHEWLAECDPVAAFRHALRDTRVIPPAAIGATVLPENYSIRTEGAAVVPV